MRDSFKMINECIQNDDIDMQLTNIKNTTIILSKGGENFFIGYIEDVERY